MASKDIPAFPPPHEWAQADEAPARLSMFICYLAYSVIPMRDIERAFTIAMTMKGRDSMPPEFYAYAEKIARQLVSDD